MSLFTRSACTGFTIVFILLALVNGCATTDKDPTKDWTAERFYTEGKAALKRRSYTEAIKHFETLEARYPYGPYAEQGQLEIVYAYYKNIDMASTISAANRFIRLHPTHPHVDYAHYLKGLAYFNDEQNFFERLFSNRDKSERDTQGMRDAYYAFRELTQRFPQSPYVEDSRLRMAYLIDLMAKNELHIARYYYGRGAYVAAVNRAKYVIENYQRTTSVEEALAIQGKAYKKMGMEDLAGDTLRVLEKNFPASRYPAEINALKGERNALK